MKNTILWLHDFINKYAIDIFFAKLIKQRKHQHNLTIKLLEIKENEFKKGKYEPTE